MSPTDREPYLRAVDAVLSPFGLKRTNASFEWKRRDANRDVEWLNLNFGLGVINPSFGVNFEDLALILPPDAGVHYGVARMLEPISGNSYSLDTAPSLVAADVAAVGLPELRRLTNRVSVIDCLSSNNPRDWPTLSASARNRLLPLLLAASGRVEAALALLTQLELDPGTIDQHKPGYPIYAAHFRARYSAEPGAQPDGPVRGFSLVTIGAARRVA